MGEQASGNRQQPEYRPPMAAGQQYPPLGYGPDGMPRHVYGADARPARPEPRPEQVPPEPEPPSDDSRRRVLLGAAVALLAVIVVVAGFWAFDGGDDTPQTTRADVPVPQNTTDPYLPGTIEPPRRVPGETDRPTPAGRQAQLSVAAEPGSTVLYVGDGGAELEQMAGPRWARSVPLTRGVLALRVIVVRGAAASCTVTVDGEVVSRDESPAGQPGLLTCRVAG